MHTLLTKIRCHGGRMQKHHKGPVVHMRLSPDASAIAEDLKMRLGLSQTGVIEVALRCLRAIERNSPQMLHAFLAARTIPDTPPAPPVPPHTRPEEQSHETI